MKVFTITTKEYYKGEITNAYNDGVYIDKQRAVTDLLESVIAYVLDLEKGGYYEISDYMNKYNETVDGDYQVRVYNHMGELILTYTILSCNLRGLK